MYEYPFVLQISGGLALASPLQACSSLESPSYMKDRIVIVERGQCMFIDKVSTNGCL